MNQYIDLASESVIWENIGGQIVTANMNSGVYCNIESGTGVVLWHLLLSGLSFDEAGTLIQSHYNAIPTSFAEHLRFFTNKLVAANIWQYIKQARIPDIVISQVITDYDQSAEYKQPAIITYDDIDTLLQLDPIDDEIGELLHAD